MSIIGLGEDGPNGLSAASRAALDAAETVFGAPRHLALAGVGARGRDWPVPFSVQPVLALRGRKVAVLASGDPFWHGAGGSLARHLTPGEWRAFPAASTFSLAAARLGWRIEETVCLGLHAAPFERLLPHLGRGVRAICLMRDGRAPAELAHWLSAQGFGASTLWIMEALGGPRERLREARADAPLPEDIAAPVAVAVALSGHAAVPASAGLADDLFESDGTMTKRMVRALTVSALAPRPNELLWDIGAGSGTVAVEWARTAPGARAIALEPKAERRDFIRRNAATFGLSDRIVPVAGTAPEALADLPDPDAVFIGGGGSEATIAAALARLRPGGRLVANAVTLESEALLSALYLRHGGTLERIEIASAAPLGRLTGWDRARPIVQWSLAR